MSLKATDLPILQVLLAMVGIKTGAGFSPTFYSFISSGSTQFVATLPATANAGDLIYMTGAGSGGWILEQNNGQTIHYGTQNTTTGTAGSLASTHQYDCVTLQCVNTNTDFVVISSVGNITIT